MTVATVAVGLLVPAAVQAQDAAAGAELAQRFCAGCHVVDDNQTGAVPDGVPSFRAIAARPDITEDGLAAILVKSPHPMMPDPPLTQRQIAHVAAYIVGLRP